MTAKHKLPLTFSMVLFLSLTLGLILHLTILHFSKLALFENLILLSYGINFLLAALIFVGLYISRKRLKNSLGFLFMGGSLLKFAIFFILFYPVYKQDGEMQGLEFAAFFVPYLIALILETVFASKMLNQTE